MKKSASVCVVVAGAGLFAVACGGSESPPPQDAVQTASATVAPSSSSAMSSSPQSTITEAALGEAQTTSVGVKATPFTLENPTTREIDADFAVFDEGQPWAVLDAQLCAGTKSLSKTGYGFTLLDADGREYKSYDSTAQPFSPTISGGNLAPGECTRGFVNFELPAGVQVVTVRWDYPGGEGPLRWTLQ